MKSERISIHNGKDTIHYGAPQACGWGGHNILHYGKTIDKNPFEKCLGVIIIGNYQTVSKDGSWEYEPLSD